MKKPEAKTEPAPEKPRCNCGCGLPLLPDGRVSFTRPLEEVMCACGCKTKMHVTSHQAAIGIGNTWYEKGHAPRASVAFTVPQ